MGVDGIFYSRNWPLVSSPFWSVVVFALGSIVGSFLNVCIYRLPRDLSIVSPPSHCPHCKYSIPFYLNLPLLTWLMLRGRCKNCGAPISPRYFVVELLTGMAFLACWQTFGSGSPALALVYAVFLAGLIVATFIDFEHFIIPDEITLGGAVAGLVCSIIFPQLHGVHQASEGVARSLLGLATGGCIIWAVLELGKLLFGREKILLPGETKIVFTENSLCLPDKEIPYEEIFSRKSDAIVLQARTVELIDRSYHNVPLRLVLRAGTLKIADEEMNAEHELHMDVVCSEIILPREAMGFGDVKFMAAIGAFIGWQGTVFSLMASSIIGSLVGVTLIVMRRSEWSSKIPFGPYIALAAALWIFGGKNLFAAFFQ